MYILDQDREKIIKMSSILKIDDTLYLYDENGVEFEVGIYTNEKCEKIILEIARAIKNKETIYIMPE